MTKRRVLLGAGAALLGAAAVLYFILGRGAGRFRGRTGDANVLLITVDTLRADHVGAYGYRQIRTPAIDALADTGVLFENAITPAVMTLPSHASILTGLYPPAHGIRDNGDFRLNQSILTLAESLRARGLFTGAVVGSFVLDSMFGLDQGFQSYDDTLPEPQGNASFLAERPARAVTEAALRFLESAQGARFFLWVHYFDPHHPYLAPSPFREQYPRQGYDAEIAYVDSEVGRLLAWLATAGARDKTLVVLVADHGEGLNDHGEHSHGVFIYDETIRVPMILSFPPHLPAGRRVGATASTVDLMPTILDLIRIDPREAGHEIQGTSLWPLIALEESAGKGRPAYAEAMTPLLDYGWSPLRAIRDDRWKYIEAPSPELYDLTQDPGEKNNLASARRELASGYRARLQSLREQVTRTGMKADAVVSNPEVEARLRSLGYIGGSGSIGSVDAAGLPDPKDQVGALTRINNVYLTFGARQFRETVREAAGILQENPDNASVRYYMAGALQQMGRHEEALEQYGILLERSPDDTEVMSNMGSCLINMERFDEATATFEKVLEIYPDHVHALASLGNVAFVKGDFAEAARIYREVLKQEPNHMSSLLTLAGLAESAGKFEQAAAIYAHAAEVDPGNPDILLNLGWAAFQQGKHEEALEALRRAREIAPDAPQIALAMGDVLLETRQFEEARASYERGLEVEPRAAAGHYGLGLIEMKQGDPAKAVGHFEKAVALNPSKGSWREKLGEALASQGRYGDAARQLERYLASGQAPPQLREQILQQINTYRQRGG